MEAHEPGIRSAWLRRAAPALVVGYFALVLVPKVLPAFGGTSFFFLYLLSIPVAVTVLTGLGIWGGVGLLRSTMRERPPRPRHRALVLVAGAGLASCVLAIALLRVLPRPLPTGSDRLSFNAQMWQAAHAADYVEGDITLRQKMLADVVRNVLPGRTRAELERALGPSLDTFYFASTGRDLIYPLGPERDSWFGIDSEWLLIWLDDGGRFQRYAIVND